MSGTGEARPTLPAQSGTTLIEALVVVAITTMTALIGFPAMRQGLLTLARQQTVSVVAARLRQARAEALRTDGPVLFAVAADGRTYGTSDGPAAATPTDVTLATSGAAGGRIIFYGDGSSSGGVIWIRAARRAVAVAVTPLSGAIAVERG